MDRDLLVVLACLVGIGLVVLAGRVRRSRRLGGRGRSGRRAGAALSPVQEIQGAPSLRPADADGDADGDAPPAARTEPKRAPLESP